MTTKKSSPNHGGARPGAGRPVGSGNKVRLEDLMMDLELETNMPYTRRLAINYQHAIARLADAVATRAAAFAAALSAVVGNSNETK